MRIATFTTAVGMMIVAGTVAIAQSVTYDFDRATDFSRIKTYQWTEGTTLRDELNHKRVVGAIDRQLMLKGLVKAEGGVKPDVLVAYHASFDRDLQINMMESGWGGPRFGGLRSGTATTQKILTGTLVIEVVNAATHSIVWRGMAKDELDADAKPEKREKDINRAAEKLFKNYPPKS
jgi:uncharacterized protein DUF4136